MSCFTPQIFFDIEIQPENVYLNQGKFHNWKSEIKQLVLHIAWNIVSLWDLPFIQGEGCQSAQRSLIDLL